MGVRPWPTGSRVLSVCVEWGRFPQRQARSEPSVLSSHPQCPASRIQPPRPRPPTEGRTCVAVAAPCTTPSVSLFSHPFKIRRYCWGSFRQTVQRAVRNTARGALLTTHSMAEAEAVCDRVAIMVSGRLRWVPGWRADPSPASAGAESPGGVSCLSTLLSLPWTRCIGSVQHLKSKFGKDYLLEVKVKALTLVEGPLGRREGPPSPPSRKESACDVGFDPRVGKIPWRRKWQPSPVFLPGESHGQRSPVGYGPWGRKESDMTEQLNSNKDTQETDNT